MHSIFELNIKLILDRDSHDLSACDEELQDIQTIRKPIWGLPAGFLDLNQLHFNFIRSLELTNVADNMRKIVCCRRSVDLVVCFYFTAQVTPGRFDKSKSILYHKLKSEIKTCKRCPQNSKSLSLHKTLLIYKLLEQVVPCKSICQKTQIAFCLAKMNLC